MYTPVSWHCKPKRLDPPGVPSSVLPWPQVHQTLAGDTVVLSLPLFRSRLEDSHGDRQNTTCNAPTKLHNIYSQIHNRTFHTCINNSLPEHLVPVYSGMSAVTYPYHTTTFLDVSWSLSRTHSAEQRLHMARRTRLKDGGGPLLPEWQLQRGHRRLSETGVHMARGHADSLARWPCHPALSLPPLLFSNSSSVTLQKHAPSLLCQLPSSAPLRTTSHSVVRCDGWPPLRENSCRTKPLPAHQPNDSRSLSPPSS